MHEDLLLVDLQWSCAQGPMTFLSARSGPAWQRRRRGTWILSARSGPAWQRNGLEWTSMAEKGRRRHGRAGAYGRYLISSRDYGSAHRGSSLLRSYKFKLIIQDQSIV